MGLDSELLLAFLVRPRTLDEVARHFGLNQTEAQQLVIKAVESGQILVSSDLTTRQETVGDSPRVDRTGLASRFKSLQGVEGRRPVQLGNSRVPPRVKIRREDLLFKLRRDKPSIVHGAPPRLQVSEIISWRKTSSRSNGRISLSEETRLLEMLNPGPRSLSELQAALGLSREIVEGFVRTGLLRCDWGPKGVGNFYKITRKGLGELHRLRVASSLDSGIVRKKLISLKRAVPQLA